MKWGNNEKRRKIELEQDTRGELNPQMAQGAAPEVEL